MTGPHVLYVIDSVVPGGAERSLAAMAPHLVARGVRLDVAYLKDRPGLQAELAAAGAELHCLDGSGGRAGWARRATRLARRRRPDLIHTTLFEGDIAGRVAAVATRTPVVTSLVNVNYGPEHYGDPALRRWRLAADQLADAASARSVRRFHAVAQTVADTLSRRLRLDPRRIDVIPRGRDLRTLGARSPARSAAARRALGVVDGERIVLAVARQEQAKGLDVLLHAMVGVDPPARLVVAGREGNHTPLLLRLVDELGLRGRVTFLGERSDVADLLCAADLFVLPSRREGLPGSLLEAMALVTPAVASDLPQVREVVDDTSAWLVAPEQPTALAETLTGALRDTEAAAAKASLAHRRFVEHFTIETCTDRMVTFYRIALAEQSGRSRLRP